jgi:choice-of-anchor B domain-containing protein
MPETGGGGCLMFDSMRVIVLAVASSALLAAGAAGAHRGAEHPLFVAEGGLDRGDCKDANAPCASLGYALSVAGKGAEIRVAAGTYPIEKAEDLFLVVSGLGEVLGGFRLPDFVADPDGVSTLTGVPSEYRELLAGRGFNIVPDRKAIRGPGATEAGRLVALHGKLKSGATVAPCIDGTAGDLECQAVDLLAHFSFGALSAPAASATDVWGFVDLNTGREYALVGYDIGTGVIDITDPENPAEVGFIDGQRASWRDIKVYQFFDETAARWRAYAYVTTDGSTDGLFVIDLSGLPHSIRKLNHQSDYFSAHNVYATNTDYSTGVSLNGEPPLLVIAGSNIGDGRYRAYSLADPADPVFVAGAPLDGYMHDASSIVITDARKDTQCINAGDRCEVLFDFNEDVANLWDVSIPENPQSLGSASYAGFGYVHSGWWSEDRQYMFVHDEADEQQGLNTTLRVFSIADLRSPVQAGTWTGPTRAIDHNGYVRGNRYYMSNYSRGLTVLDITDPTTPVTVGRLDTFPFSDASSFVGAWGAYPFFFSNTVAVSDIDSGLYLARDMSLDVPEGSFSFSQSSYAADEGQRVPLTVKRTGGSSGDVAVGFEILHATARADDHLTPSGSLAWTDGDTSDRIIEIPLANDGVDEGLERLFVRLVDPQGGATVGEHNVASVYLSDPGAAGEIGFMAETVETAERGFAHAVLVLRRSGSAVGAASVDFAVSGDSAVFGSDFEGPESGTIDWAAGDGDPRNLVFRILDDGSAEDDEIFHVTLQNATGAALAGSATATVTILDGSGANTAPNAVAGSGQSVGPGASVTLDGSQSDDPDGDPLSFAWTQTDGPGVTLDGADTDTATFTAPSVDSDTMLRFRLTVTDPSGLEDTATAVVTVTSASSGGGDSGGSGTAGALALLCALGALARALRRRGGA